MAFAGPGLVAASNGIITGATFAQLYTAAPNGTGATNASTAARVAVGWGTPNTTTGVVTNAAPINFSGAASSGPITYVGLWSAATAGTFYGAFPLDGDLVANSAGAYTIQTITLTPS